MSGPHLAAAIAESAPTLALPRKRERESAAFGVADFRTMDTYFLSQQQARPPLPLAGEGWGGGLSALETSMAETKSPTWKVSAKLRSNARALRKTSTDAERLLWASLRGHRLNGASFRRQVPIDNYIADFVCHAAQLVIELDGGQHFSDSAEKKDAARSAVIEAKGFRVLRFNNHDVMTNRDGVLEAIAAVIAESAPTLTLQERTLLVSPRKRERGQEKQPS